MTGAPPPVAPAQDCTLSAGAGSQVRRVHCGVKIPSGSRVVGRLVQYPTGADCMEAYTASKGVHPTFMEVPLFPPELVNASLEAAERFHQNYYLLPSTSME